MYTSVRSELKGDVPPLKRLYFNNFIAFDLHVVITQFNLLCDAVVYLDNTFCVQSKDISANM